MNSLVNSGVKFRSKSPPRRHEPTADFRPVCGGGNGAKTAQWQEDIGEPNCAACAAISYRLKHKAQP